MNLKAGIVGLPNVGKSTLFNAITKLAVEAANYPFATIDPNIGIVELNDIRLNKIAKIANSKNIIPAIFQFVDIAGLVKGASLGQGLGNKFLTNIRESDAIIHLIRCFEDDNITHVENKVDPINDLEVINLELLLSDMQMLENILKRLTSKVKTTKDKLILQEHSIAKRIFEGFKSEKAAREIGLTDEEMKLVKSYNLLTLKPILYIANIAEDNIQDPSKDPNFNKLKEYLDNKNVDLIPISAQIELEISQLNKEDQKVFLDDLNLSESGLNKIVNASFKLLGLSTFFTAGEQESRAWVFNNGYTAPQCAGVIHTDFERGFIKAEVISYIDFIEFNGELGAKNNGKLNIEGKNYIIKDGDICHFRFNI